MKKIGETTHSMKMMWACIAFAVIAVILVSSGFGAGAFFLIPCVLMIGAIVWMMGGMGSSPRSGNKS